MFRWNDETVARVEELLRQGYSSGQIAKDIGNPSRGSVIGKIHRSKTLSAIGLGGNISKEQKPVNAQVVKPPRQKIQPHNIVNKKVSRSLDKLFRGPTVAEPEYNLDALRLTLTELGPRQCKWDVANPNVGEEYLFCGKPTEDLRPWCSHHHKLAFRVSS